MFVAVKIFIKKLFQEEFQEGSQRLFELIRVFSCQIYLSIKQRIHLLKLLIRSSTAKICIF